MMKSFRYVFFFFFLFVLSGLMAQDHPLLDPTLTENVGDRERFLMYVDTIDKYLYRDAKIVDEAIEICERMTRETTGLQSEDLFKYGIQKIYYEQNNSKYLEAYRTVNRYNHLLEDDEIPEKLKDSFLYIKGFTLMNLGDLQSALRVFYQLAEKAEKTNSIKLKTNAFYSLGQIYSDEEQYDKAIRYFLELAAMKGNKLIRPSTQSLVDYELAETYLRSKQYDKAANLIEEALVFIDQEGVDLLKADFLNLKGDIALHQKDLEHAKRICEEVDQLTAENEDPLAIRNNQLLKAQVLEVEKRYDKALTLYQQVLQEADSTDFKIRLDCQESIHQLYHKLGNASKAYDYSVSYNNYKEEVDAIKKEEQTAYLQIKFDVAQKERENQILALQVLEEQSQIRWLYLLAFLFLLGMLLFYGAFLQKKRFNQKLRAEVRKRTEDLEKANKALLTTNKELDEFNRILSHDLREPLRSIVGFSDLALRDGHQDPSINEYLKLIKTSGRQLDQIIRDVNTFQKARHQIDEVLEEVNLNLLMPTLIDGIREEEGEKTFQVSFPNLPTLYTNREVIRLSFEQLILNGVKFNENDEPQIDIRYYQGENHYHFEIEDNGIGINEQYHQSIFEMFKRLHSRGRYLGSGLGLSLVRKVLEKVKGRIKILRSVEKEGTVFCISIPILGPNDLPTEVPSENLYSVATDQ